MGEMQNLRRYLCEPELAACERLFALVRRKDDLDFHAARQGLLKIWLFLHIGLTTALVAFAFLHGLLALAHFAEVACERARRELLRDAIRAAEPALGLRVGRAGHACSAGPRREGVPGAGRVCADSRWRPLVVQPVAVSRWAVRRGPTPDGGCGCVHVCQPVRSLAQSVVDLSRRVHWRLSAACSSY